MADVIGTAASIAGLAGAAITLIQQIQAARESVRERPKKAKNVSTQLEILAQSLHLVREETRLQTTDVEQQVSVIVAIAEELKGFYDRLQVEQKRNAILSFVQILYSGNKHDKELGEILGRLDRAKDDLMLRISVTLVGLVGNLKDGFHVAVDVLMDTNSRVKQALGTNLALADRLKGRTPQQIDRIIRLDEADIESIGLANPQTVAGQIPISQLHIDGKTGDIDVGGYAEGVNTGISIQGGGAARDSTDKYPGAVSAIIGGSTGEIRVGQNAKGVNTGISVV